MVECSTVEKDFACARFTEIEMSKPHRIDWFRVLTDLRVQGYSLHGVSEVTGIPRTTLIGYKDLDVEPRHSDGEALLALWERAMLPPLPTKESHRKNSRESDSRPERQYPAS